MNSRTKQRHEELLSAIKLKEQEICRLYESLRKLRKKIEEFSLNDDSKKMAILENEFNNL